MTIEKLVKEIKKTANLEESVDEVLLKKVLEYLGTMLYAGDTIDTANKKQVKEIKDDFIIDKLGQSQEIAKAIIQNIKASLKKGSKINKVIFYYLIVKEVTSSKYRIPNIHPGEVLLEEFLTPLNLSAYKLSKDINIPQTRISAILKGKRRITADTALRLSRYFGNSAKFWLGLQDDYDIEESNKEKILDLIQIEKMTIANN